MIQQKRKSMQKANRNDCFYCFGGKMAQKLGWAYLMASYRREFIRTRRMANHI